MLTYRKEHAELLKSHGVKGILAKIKHLFSVPADWHSLRVGGLICAGVLCFLGIVIYDKKKCFKKSSAFRAGQHPALENEGSFPPHISYCY
uniref:FXYD domain-containing ion transport regulator n=1 Tax=Salvator merianae TaxID=96440 RepID=A0A8D0BZ33_SALMN